jgi:hypothetical protein
MSGLINPDMGIVADITSEKTSDECVKSEVSRNFAGMRS